MCPRPLQYARPPVTSHGMSHSYSRLFHLPWPFCSVRPEVQVKEGPGSLLNSPGQQAIATTANGDKFWPRRTAKARWDHRFIKEAQSY